MIDQTRSDEKPAADTVPDDVEVVQDRGGATKSAIPGFDTEKNKPLIAGAAIAAVAAVLAIGAMSGGSDNAEKKKAATEQPKEGTEAYRIKDDGIVAPMLADAPTDPNAPVKLSAEQVPAIDAQASDGATIAAEAHANGQSGPPKKSEAQILREASRRSTLVAYSGELGGRGGFSGGQFGGQPRASNEDEPTALDNMRRVSKIGQAQASSIGNRNMLIVAGSVIPCVLTTAMDSSQPGYTACIIPRDVYSDNGRVILLEKGTKVLGEYQGGLDRGRYRLFVMWNRAVTPRGVSINLNSPASDAMGRAGLAGGVKTFFWDKFGSALLFSAIEDASYVAGQAVGSGTENMVRTPSNTSSTLLRDANQVKPVIRKNQGEDVSIFVSHDFDFSNVYDLKLRGR